MSLEVDRYRKPGDYLADARDFYRISMEPSLNSEQQAQAVAKGHLAASIGLLMGQLPTSAWMDWPEDFVSLFVRRPQ